MNYLVSFALLVLMTLVSGCTVMKPPPDYRQGSVVDTLSAPVSLSILNAEHGMSGSGFMVYRRPDNLRVIILTPFGTTMTDVVVTGDRITIMDVSKSAAFKGLLSDLPGRGQGQMWSQVRWIMESEPAGSGLRSGTIERLNRQGHKELVTYENGLIVSKRNPEGDEVHYGDFVVINGVPLATEVIMDTASRSRFRVKLSEPEVNAELSPESFVPRLDGYTVYPLSMLDGK